MCVARQIEIVYRHKKRPCWMRGVGLIDILMCVVLQDTAGTYIAAAIVGLGVFALGHTTAAS